MITVNQEPEDHTPAYNEIIFVVTSDKKTEANFKYVADLYVDGVSTNIRVKRQPHPTLGSAFFDFGRIIETYVTHDISKATYGFQQNLNSYARYQIKFGEEFGLSSSGTTIYPNQVLTQNRFAWNAVLDHLDFKDFADSATNQYVLNSPTSKFLTNMPTSGVIGTSEDAWLYMMTDTANDVRRVKINTYDSAGTLIQTVEVNNPFRLVTSSNDRHIRFGCGTRNINLLDSSGVTSGALPIITASVARYSINTINALATSETRWFKIESPCTRNVTYRFHFLNPLGGFDSFTFIRGSQKTSEIKRSTYKKITGGLTSASAYGYNKSDRGTTQYNTSIKDNIRVKSDWIKEETFTWLAELVESREVYLDDPTHGIVPVIIQNNKYDFKQDAQEKLFNLEIEFEYAFDRYSQRG